MMLHRTSTPEGLALGEKLAALSFGRYDVGRAPAADGGSELFIARLLHSGEFDPTFGSDGIARVDLGDNFARATALRVDTTAHITVVVGGFQGLSSPALLVARLLDSGELDASFGQGGFATGSFFPPGEVGVIGGLTIDERPQSVVPTALGLPSPGAQRIVAVGSVGHVNEDSFAVARYTFNGELDSAFGADGQVITSFSAGTSVAASARTDSEGGIVAVGTVNSAADGLQFAVVRYRADGSRESTFGGDGVVRTSFPTGECQAFDVAFAGHNIVAAGILITNGIPTRIALVRYLPDGLRDPAFGTDGRVQTDFDDDLVLTRAVAIDGRDRVVVAGELGDRFVLSRYDSSNGHIDPDFGTGGKATVDFTALPRHGGALALAIDSDNRLIPVGYSAGQVAVARLREDGSLDPTFSGNGKLRKEITVGRFSRATAVTLDGAGRILVAGPTFA